MIKVSGKTLAGTIRAIASKSYAHRALIAASLAEGESIISFNESSDDINFTISTLNSLGAGIEAIEGGVHVRPIEKLKYTPRLDVGESGTTLRLILPLAASIYDRCGFLGRGRLGERPIIELMEAMKPMGVSFDSDRLPFQSQGRLKSGDFKLAGNVSSQYISGLLFAAPLLDGESTITLTSKLESKAYVDMTIDLLNSFGIEVNSNPLGYSLKSQSYLARDYEVEGDWSNSSFFLVAGALGQSIILRGLRSDSLQGDMKILNILKDFGAKVTVYDEEIKVERDKFKNLEVDLAEIPDALPILAVAASAVDGGVSRFYNGKRLRFKESDRLSSVATMIEDLGGRVEELEEELLVYGTGGLRGGRTSSFGDHRLVMAATIASSISDNPVIIENPEAVTKSYPKFFLDFKKLGGEVSGQ